MYLNMYIYYILLVIYIWFFSFLCFVFLIKMHRSLSIYTYAYHAYKGIACIFNDMQCFYEYICIHICIYVYTDLHRPI